MKNITTIEIPLSGKDEAITLPPPCIYCGAKMPTESKYLYKHSASYELKNWIQAADTGNLFLIKQLDENNQSKKANVTIEAPYCNEHQKGIIVYSIMDGLSMIIGALAGFFVVLKFNTAITFFNIILFCFFIASGAGVFYLLAVFAKKQLSRIIKKYQDFPAWSGHWGMEFDIVRIDSNEASQGPVEYFLPISLTNTDSVERVIRTFPGSKIVKQD